MLFFCLNLDRFLIPSNTPKKTQAYAAVLIIDIHALLVNPLPQCRQQHFVMFKGALVRALKNIPKIS